MDNLYDESTKKLYQQKPNQKLKNNIIEKTTQIIYEHIEDAIHEAAMEALGEPTEYNKTKIYKI